MNSRLDVFCFLHQKKKQVFWIDITAICQMDMCSARAGHFVQSLIIINMFGLGMKQGRIMLRDTNTDREWRWPPIRGRGRDLRDIRRISPVSCDLQHCSTCSVCCSVCGAQWGRGWWQQCHYCSASILRTSWPHFTMFPFKHNEWGGDAARHGVKY